MEVRKGREKPRAPEKKEEKAKDSRAAPAERSGRQDPRPKERTPEDKPIRAPRAPKEQEQQPHKKRGREGKESRRERDEPRKDGGKSRTGRAEHQESTRRDWRQLRGEQRGKKPWEQAGKDGTARPREGRRRD